MNEYPLLSVTMPVYNVEQYLSKAIESVLNQNYRNIELIIVDDGSTDKSGDICDKYAQDPRVRVFHKKNEGLVATREFALNHIKGDYVTFVDSDDWIEKHTFAEMMDFIVQNNVDVGIYGYTLDYGNKNIRKFKSMQDSVLPSKDVLSKMLYGEYFGWELADKIYKSSFTNEVKIPSSIVCGEDLVRNYLLFQKCNNIGIHQMFSYHYVQRATSITKSKTCKEETLLPAVEYLLAKGESKEQLKDVWLLGIIEFLKMIVLNDKYDEVNYEQKELRKNILYILRKNRFSIRQKIGTIILCLPFSITKITKKILKYDMRVRNE